jgi:hypothetical protein
MKLRLFITLGLSVILSGCWSKNFDEPGRIEVPARPTVMGMGASFQRTWGATQAVVAKLPIIKRDIDANTGRAYLVTDWIRGKSDRLYHGFDVNRMPYVIRYKLYIYIVGDVRGGNTNVTIKNTEQYLDDVITAGVDIQGNVESWIKTESSTLKENALLNQIDKLIRDPNFKDEAIQ